MNTSAPPKDRLTLAVIGNGMSGYRFCERMVAKQGHKQMRLVVFGEESVMPYDRLHLSRALQGSTTSDLTLAGESWYHEHGIELHLGDAIEVLDTARKKIVSSKGLELAYDKVVLATGAHPYIPAIQFEDSKGVFFYRSMGDLQAIRAYMNKAHGVAVIGSGMLSLEAVDMFNKLGFNTHLIEQSSRLLITTLGPNASQLLQEKLSEKGITVHLNRLVRQIETQDDRKVLLFRDGSALRTDMVILAAGIVPNDMLAAEAGIRCGLHGGIIVDDYMQTSSPDVYALGECALHRGVQYGLAAPRAQMAEVLVRNLLHDEGLRFTGGNPASTLDLDDHSLALLGNMRSANRSVIYKNEKEFRQLMLRDGHLVGAIVIGKWLELTPLREAVARRERIGFFRLRRFKKQGSLFNRRQTTPVKSWKSNIRVCQCLDVNIGDLRRAKKSGSGTVDGVCQKTGAGTGCGLCKPLIQEFLDPPN